MAPAPTIRQLLDGGADNDVRALYALAGYEPLWTGKTAANARDTALAEIRRRPFHGLPADPDCSSDPPAAAADAAGARGDIALTACLMRLRAAVSEGTVPQSEMGDWHLSGEALPVTRADLEDIRRGEIKALLLRAAPQSKDYMALQESLARYLEIAAAGGWAQIPGTSELLLDGSDPRLEALKPRLAVESYLVATDNVPADLLESAVRRFQGDRGLVADARVGRQTLAALNTTVEERITQIAVNMERWRHMPRAFGESYIIVNVADASLAVIENAQVSGQMRTIVGSATNQTPSFRATITGVTVNPPWTIPASIAAKEILPKLKRNPRYLADNDIVILNREADPFGLQVAWDSVGARRFPFQLRQRPDSKNPLGLIKFEMSNPFDVYLHDTSARSLFALPRRALSHGCVRVEAPEALAARVLPDQTAEQIGQEIASGATKTLPRRGALPVYILYWTAFSGENGALQFRDDVYGRDGAIARALQRHDRPPAVGTNPLVSQDSCPPVA